MKKVVLDLFLRPPCLKILNSIPKEYIEKVKIFCIENKIRYNPNRIEINKYNVTYKHCIGYVCYIMSDDKNQWLYSDNGNLEGRRYPTKIFKRLKQAETFRKKHQNNTTNKIFIRTYNYTQNVCEK